MSVRIAGIPNRRFELRRVDPTGRQNDLALHMLASATVGLCLKMRIGAARAGAEIVHRNSSRNPVRSRLGAKVLEDDSDARVGCPPQGNRLKKSLI